MVFSVKVFFSLRSAAELFFSRHYFFSTKTIFCKTQSAINIIFFPAHFRDRKMCSIKFANRKVFPTKNIALRMDVPII